LTEERDQRVQDAAQAVTDARNRLAKDIEDIAQEVADAGDALNEAQIAFEDGR